MALRLWTIGIGLTAAAIGIAVMRYAFVARDAIQVAIAGS